MILLTIKADITIFALLTSASFFIEITANSNAGREELDDYICEYFRSLTYIYFTH